MPYITAKRKTKGQAEIIINNLRKTWPHLVIQEEYHTHCTPLEEIPSDFFERMEAAFFIYENKKWFQSWNKYGSTKTNIHKMIHVIVTPVSIDVHYGEGYM